MSKLMYVKPMFLANGTIVMTASQLAALGLDDSEWAQWWEDAGDYVVYENFDINDPDTWPEFFDSENSETWDLLTVEP